MCFQDVGEDIYHRRHNSRSVVMTYCIGFRDLAKNQLQDLLPGVFVDMEVSSYGQLML